MSLFIQLIFIEPMMCYLVLGPWPDRNIDVCGKKGDDVVNGIGILLGEMHFMGFTNSDANRTGRWLS